MTDSGCRIIHRASGAVGESRSERSQHQNKRLAFGRLVKTAKFKLWLARTVHEIITGKTTEERVEEAMSPEKLKVEILNELGKWINES